jgi:aspartate ammonia-lyase
MLQTAATISLIDPTMHNIEHSFDTHAFSETRPLDIDFINALILVKRAAAIANEVSPEIISLLENLQSDPKPLLKAFEKVDAYQGGGGIAVHLAFNEVVRCLAQEQLRADVSQVISLGQSTADVLSTSFRLCFIKKISGINLYIQELKNVLESKANEFSAQQITARTCLRDAGKADFSIWWQSFSSALREIDYAGLKQLWLGGTVTGSSEGAVYKKDVINVLSSIAIEDFKPSENFYSEAQHSMVFVRLASDLENLALVVLKSARDLRLLFSGPKHGFADIELPALMAGSSFFKGKINPTLCESVIQAMILISQRLSTVRRLREEAELDLNVYEPAMGFLLIESLNMMATILPKYSEHCLKGVKIA